MIPRFLLRFLRGLKFPWLFAVTAVLFAVDLVVPDMMPFADELLLGLSTLLLGAWRNKKQESRANADVPPSESPEDAPPDVS